MQSLRQIVGYLLSTFNPQPDIKQGGEEIQCKGEKETRDKTWNERNDKKG